MGCPHCKLSLGWGPTQEIPEGVKWYKRVVPRLKCKHCGKYVVAVRNEKFKWLGFTCFFAAGYLLGYHSEFEYFTPVMIALLAVFVYAAIGYANSIRFEKDEKT